MKIDKIWTKEDIELLKNSYPTKGKKYCSEILNRTIGSVGAKAFNLGLKVEKNTIYQIYSKNRIDADKFINLNDPISIYILGLIWADGCVTFANNKSKTPQIKHSCVYYDSDDFNRIFKINGDWGTFNSDNKKSIGKNLMSIRWTSNRNLGNYLINNGFRDKIYPKLFDSISNDIKQHFIRGFFDGDGCITKQLTKGKYESYSIYFSGDKKQDWSFLTNTLDNLNIKYKFRTLNDELGTSTQIYFASNTSTKIFYEFLYRDSDGIFLSRKKEIFDQLFKYRNTI